MSHIRTRCWLWVGLVLLGVFLASGLAMGGERWRENLGITVDEANRNADAIRRDQNRRTRDINRLHNYDAF